MQAQQPVLRQEQRLRMTPQLYQAIRIMALPLADLQLTIDQELERNPALEVVSEDPTDSLDELEDRPEEELFGDSSDPGFQSLRTHADPDARQRFLDGALQRPETLQEHLLWQVRLQPVDGELMHAAELLIHNLDDNGFFREPPEVAAPDIDPRTIERAQRLVQGLDPVGTCVADYRESLTVQIRHHDAPAPHAAAVVEGHLDALERGRLDEIAHALDIPVGAVHEVLAFVRTLEPLPGRNFPSEPTRYVVPDVIVRMHDGELAIILNEEVIPVLGVDSFFERIGGNGLGPTAAGKEARRFAKTNLQEARSFIRNVAARNRSLVRVTRKVVDHQREFFRSGPKQLRPLTLRDVAEEVDLHEATVSRIVNGKFVQTEWGIYELRHFFTNSISGAGSRGSQYSKAGVKEVVREIIEAERPDGKRLSDSRIAAILAERGIKIARRTVAKYRGELDIESSLER
jgi:RNA polymerase sigma-54 factor